MKEDEEIVGSGRGRGREDTGGTLLYVLYATETGNAEEVAYDIAKRVQNNSLVARSRVKVQSIADFDVLTLPELSVAIFVVSTAGDGDPPKAMKDFWAFILRKSLSSQSLQQLRFAVFGLGDSSYEKFNATGRKLFVRLKQLGAVPLIDLGLADDQARYYTPLESPQNAFKITLL